MRKIFTTAALSLLCIGAIAQDGPSQISQGTVVLSGSAQFNQTYTKPDESVSKTKSRSQTVVFSPSAGYMLRDGLEIGLGIGLLNSLNKTIGDNGEARSKQQALSISPYIRKYVALTDFLLLHGTGYTSIRFGRNLESESQEDTYHLQSRHNGLQVGLYPGLTYLATPKLGITATFGNLSYSVNRITHVNFQKQEQTYRDRNFTTNLSTSSLSLGINYFINR